MLLKRLCLCWAASSRAIFNFRNQEMGLNGHFFHFSAPEYGVFRSPTLISKCQQNMAPNHERFITMPTLTSKFWIVGTLNFKLSSIPFPTCPDFHMSFSSEGELSQMKPYFLNAAWMWAKADIVLSSSSGMLVNHSENTLWKFSVMKSSSASLQWVAT